MALQETYAPHTKGNEFFFTIPQALEAVTTRTISLLSTDVKTCQLIDISRDTIEGALKGPPLNTAKCPFQIFSNVMWDILLACKEEAKDLAGSILMTLLNMQIILTLLNMLIILTLLSMLIILTLLNMQIILTLLNVTIIFTLLNVPIILTPLNVQIILTLLNILIIRTPLNIQIILTKNKTASFDQRNIHIQIIHYKKKQRFVIDIRKK